MEEAGLLSNVAQLRKNLRKFPPLCCVVGQPRSPATEDNTRYIHVQIFSAIKKNEVMSFSEN